MLRAIWRGKGAAVPLERIYSAMYADDRPSPEAQYSAFKVALSRLRKKLEGTEVAIETIGYRLGWRLVISTDPLGV